jgi:hypothetical protein
MKLSQHVQRAQARLAAEKAAGLKAELTVQMESLREDLECGDFSDTTIAVANAQERSAANARELAEATSDARETDSDAVELADLESRLVGALETIKAVNANGGFTLEQLQWAQHAVDAILAPAEVQYPLQTVATESQDPNALLIVSTENIEEVIAVVQATRENLSKGSVDAILRVLAVLEKAIPDVKDRLVGMQQSIRTIDFDEEAQIRLDGDVYKALSVDGKLPTGWKDYFASYLAFAQAILSGYSDNALESANKSSFLADALTGLSQDACPIKAITKAVDEIGDPRKKIDTDKLLFVLPGSGPLFGNDVHDAHLNGGDDDGDDAVAVATGLADDGVDTGAITDAGTAGGEGNGTVAAPTPDDNGALSAPVEDPNAQVPPTTVPVPEPVPAPAPVEPSANPEPMPAPAPALPEAAPAGAPAAPVAEPAAPAAGGEAALAPAAEPAAAPAPTEPPKPEEGEEEEEEEDDDKGRFVKESLPADEGGQITPCDALVSKLDKFSADYVPLEPLAWDDRPDGEGEDSIRVLSKDSIAGAVDSLIKALECVNIKSFGESNQQTWASARSAFAMYKKAFDNLTPQQMSDIQGATESVGDYLDTVYNLSCWPVLHVLTNLVFTSNAFLLLAERSISGQSAEEESFEPEEGIEEEEEEADDTDAQAAADAQANNDAMAGAGAADEGPAGDASVTSTT